MKRDTDYAFEWAVLRNLDSAYNLARWLVGNDADAEDVVQDASVKALNGFNRFRGEQGKAWFLAIVRNTSLDCIKRRKTEREVITGLEKDVPTDPVADPEAVLMRTFDTETLWSAIDKLPVDHREMIVMRELEGLAYREIATVIGLPIGTVMSRLARARTRLQIELVAITSEASV